MAVKLGSELGGGSKAKKYPDNSDMNVTPFVDVMLVLLIIFMVAAPLATVNVQVDLPPPNVTPEQPEKDPIFISLSENGEIIIGGLTGEETKVEWGNLGPVILERTNGDRTYRLMVRADQGVIYKDVIRALNILQQNGYDQVALIAEDVCGSGAGEVAC
ncbi:MAG TPA: biopolymer transporter ExbD [Micropepsaceae bacterium]|nr:biopolymer transporter ExbD [Micropepsaceae bacterium]